MAALAQRRGHERQLSRSRTDLLRLLRPQQCFAAARRRRLPLYVGVPFAGRHDCQVACHTLLTERLLDLAALTVLLACSSSFFPTLALHWSRPDHALLIVGLSSLVATDRLSRPNATVGRSPSGSWPFAHVRFVAKVAAWIGALTAAIEGTLSGRSRFKSDRPDCSGLVIELGVFVVVGSALSGELLLIRRSIRRCPWYIGDSNSRRARSLGHFRLFCRRGFRYSGLDAEKAVAAAVVCHIVILVPVTLLGGFQLIIDRQAVPMSPERGKRARVRCERPRVVVVGAGFSGLVCGLRARSARISTDCAGS